MLNLVLVSKDSLVMVIQNILPIIYPKLYLGIIGAGIGGTSAAHFLRQKFGTSCSISIFEEGNIGGRLATIKMAGKEYEVGGSIIHSANTLMTDLLKETG